MTHKDTHTEKQNKTHVTHTQTHPIQTNAHSLICSNGNTQVDRHRYMDTQTLTHPSRRIHTHTHKRTCTHKHKHKQKHRNKHK